MSQSKQRSVNFSKSEEEKLVAMVLEKKNIFENKKTDAVTSKQKVAAWEKLAQQFNASSETNIVSISIEFTIFTSKCILVYIFYSIDSYRKGIERKVQQHKTHAAQDESKCSERIIYDWWRSSTER